MANITKEITYDIPDKWQTSTTALGKTSTQTYTGPETVVAVIQNGVVVNAYNKEKEDGRPLAADFTHVEIDCNEDTMHCGILWGGFEPPAHFEVEVGPGSRLNPTVADPTHPTEVYDIQSFVNGWNGVAWKAVTFSKPEDDDPTIDEIRVGRNSLLQTSDQNVADDMPADVKKEWTDYRQALRDLPADFDGVPVHLITLPKAPDEVNESSEMQPQADNVMLANEDAGEGVIAIADQGGRSDWQGQLPPGIASAD
jgi:hypothetical protein